MPEIPILPTWILLAGASVLLALLVTVLLLAAGRRRAGAELMAVSARLEAIEKSDERSERAIREDLARSGEAVRGEIARNRSELATSFSDFGEGVGKRMGEIATLQGDRLESFARRLDGLTQSTEQRLDLLRTAIDQKLQQLAEENAAKLEQMRVTVDEKLQGTLEKRLGESFQQVSERLAAVHAGLGEMRTLAAGVGDLKKVLSNVKQRGGWGEVQLAVLLEQTLAPSQYESNVATRPGSGERVEFAIKLPGRDADAERPVWLPIDAKFPLEDYQRLVEALEHGDREAADLAGRELEKRVVQCAKDIQTRYVEPPHTTDFAILFLPVEGLYAEVLRRPGIVDALQREQRIVIAGPTTLVAMLNSLQMGFRTLAIEKRSSEVWKLLSAVKGEFEKFGTILDGVQKKLQEASNKMDEASRKTRTITRRLRDVEDLPPGEASRLLAGGGDDPPDGVEEA
ncbi:MAG: DNA recombination protein RmuC [Deltaproteobacteria bacterium]|nr:DNA recombination protein RmuC [Deltaproteobacteria bacterium]